MGKGHISKSFCLLILLLLSALAATCYNPPTVAGQNGTVQDSQYTTCNVNQEVSMCCRQTQSGPFTADSCLPNGLCVNESEDNMTTYWRESCTDPTWRSPYCVNALNACGMDENSNAQVTPCPNNATQYCCGSNNTACCGTSSAFYVAAVDGPSSSTTGSTSSPTSSSTPSIPSSPALSSNSGLSMGVKAGIGAGMGVAVLAALVALVFFMKRKVNIDGHGVSDLMLGNEMLQEKDGVMGGQGRLELSTYETPRELATGNEEVYNELEGDAGRSI